MAVMSGVMSSQRNEVGGDEVAMSKVIVLEAVTAARWGTPSVAVAVVVARAMRTAAIAAMGSSWYRRLGTWNRKRRCRGCEM